MQRLKQWRERRQHERQQRQRELRYAHAPDLGMTLEECDEDRAIDELRGRVGVNEVLSACEPLHGGYAMLANDRAYWWKDDSLYAAGPNPDPHGIPIAPPPVTAEAVRSAVANCACTSFTFVSEASRIHVPGLFWRLLHHKQHDPWQDARAAYTSCQTYQHTMHGNRTANVTVPGTQAREVQHQEFSSTLYFQQPDRFALDWNTSDERGPEHGWSRANGDDIRYFSSREASIVHGFTLHGAIYRASMMYQADREVCRFLVPNPLDAWDDRPQRNNTPDAIGDIPCYRLQNRSRSKWRDERGHSATSTYTTTHWLDAQRHLILRAESTYKTDDCLLTDQYEFSPVLNEPVPQSAWLPPSEPHHEPM